MFQGIQALPPDPILGLTEAFRSDPNPNKIDLGVGVYQDANGRTPVLESVRLAEKRILDGETSMSYLPIPGLAPYTEGVGALLFGAGSELVRSGRSATAQTPGGTGALRVAGDFLRRTQGGATVWLSDPTWPNHKAIFEAAGLPIATYPYYDPATKGLAFDRMLDALAKVPAGDIVLLHAACHNPTGADPDAGQWKQLADLAATQGFLPLFDFAYQGFGDGLDEDAVGLRTFAAAVPEMLIASSFSKNFGLYNQRTGGLTLVAGERDSAARAFSQVKACIRANYSNPPAHGAQIVATILSDASLRQTWLAELAAMRGRINGMRRMFVDGLQTCGVQRDFSFIARQRGMFSFSGLTKEQVLRLRDEYAIYMVDSGRMNVAGMTEQNIGRVCEAIAKVL